MTLKEKQAELARLAVELEAEHKRLQTELVNRLWNELESSARALMESDYQQLSDDVRAACFLKAAFKRVGLVHVPTDVDGEAEPRWSLPARCRSEGDWAAPPDCLPLDD